MNDADPINSAPSSEMPQTVAAEHTPPMQPIESTPPTPPALTSIKCPSCEATSQKVSLTAGVKLNCLHCGAKFFPPNAAGIAGTETDGAPVGEIATPKTREPKSPGYWLLRVPAAVVMFAGLFTTLLILWFGRHDMRFDRLENWLMAAYVPLIALAGMFAFLWSRSLARVDAGMTHRFWKLGLLREPLPPMPGSSLPYIGPLAIVGGFYPVFCYSFGHSPDDGGGPVLEGGLFGALLFLMGFMAEDIRQFAWREHAAAEKIDPPPPLNRHWPYGLNVYSWTSLTCAAGFGTFALLTAYCAYDQWTRYRRYNSYWAQDEVRLLICISLGFVACAVTGFMLCRDWDRAVASWMRAAARVTRRAGGIWLEPVPPQGVAAFTRWVPIAWAAYGAIWLLLSVLFDSNNVNNHRMEWFLLAIGSLAVVGWFWCLMLQFSCWRQAKQIACATLQHLPTPPASPRVSGWPSAVIRIAIGLACCEAALMAILLLQTSFRYYTRWEEFFAIPLLLGIAHYPTLWIATSVREFLTLEQDVLLHGTGDDN